MVTLTQDLWNHNIMTEYSHTVQKYCQREYGHLIYFRVNLILLVSVEYPETCDITPGYRSLQDAFTVFFLFCFIFCLVLVLTNLFLFIETLPEASAANDHHVL